MKKRYFLYPVFLIFYFLTNNVFAQNRYVQSFITRVTISGKVTAAATGNALQGASIYIPDLKTGTLSDANGNYVLHNIPAGNFLVQVGYVGYKNFVQKISVTIILH